MIETVRKAFNMACPACQSDEHIRIYMHTWAPLSEGGTDANDGEHVWDGDDDCVCDGCGHRERVCQFTLEEDDKKEAPVI